MKDFFYTKSPFRKDAPEKKLTLESLSSKNLKFGLDPNPYDLDPFPEFTKSLDDGWKGGISHIKRKLGKRNKK